MIYFVDEDDIQLRPLRLELQFRNIESERIGDADEAMSRMADFHVNDYLFVDVMLAVSADESCSKFGRDETDGYKTTGLVLADKVLGMIDRREVALDRNHIILMSQAASPTTRKKIDSYAADHRLRFIPKSAFDDPVAFGDAVQSIVQT